MPVHVFSIDGPDFVGKTTIANLLIEKLRRIYRGKNVIFKKTQVPSGLVTGSFTSILRNSADETDSRVFALCYALDHLHHYQQVIQPFETVNENYVFIQERSLLTTYVYQGIIGQVGFEWLDEINKFMKNIPRISIILKLNTEEIKNRKSLGRRMFDRFESVDHLDSQTRIFYDIPKNLVDKFNVVYVDADGDADIVADRCASVIQNELDKIVSM